MKKYNGTGKPYWAVRYVIKGEQFRLLIRALKRSEALEIFKRIAVAKHTVKSVKRYGTIL